MIALAIFGSTGSLASPTDDKASTYTTACDINALRSLPDVRLTEAIQVTAPAQHCKVSGVIGTETHFELLLPDHWNGKFVMGGGGGFGGTVQNSALMFGALQKGYSIWEGSWLGPSITGILE